MGATELMLIAPRGHFPIPIPSFLHFLYCWEACRYTQGGKTCALGEVSCKGEFLI